MERQSSPRYKKGASHGGSNDPYRARLAAPAWCEQPGAIRFHALRPVEAIRLAGGDRAGMLTGRHAGLGRGGRQFIPIRVRGAQRGLREPLERVLCGPAGEQCCAANRLSGTFSQLRGEWSAGEVRARVAGVGLLQVDAPARAVRPANMLLAIDSENALALAVLVDPRVGSTGDAQDRFRLAGEGVAGFRRLLKPAGMRNEEFIRLQRHVLSTLEGEAGLGYLEQKDYPTAQQYLRQAVTGAPNNGRYVYGLALAMLGQNPPQNEGYWYLARAVNLSRRTPQGAAIAEFARRQYVGAGGSEDNWERFLAVTTASTFATTNAGRASAPRTLNRQTEQSSLGVTRSQPGASQTIPRPPDAHAGPSGTVQTASLTAPATGSKTEAAPARDCNFRRSVSTSSFLAIVRYRWES